MPDKIQTYVQLAGQTAAGLTKSLESWTGFLNTASRLYKYPFPDQLLIHAQNPNSTAVADFDIWTKKMRRYVRRGSKGIALVHINNGYPRIQYVFDVSDTGAKNNSYNLILWQYREEYREVVTKALEERFGVSCENGFPGQLEDIAAKLAKDYWDDYHSQIMYELAGSPLEGLDEFNVGVQFRDIASVSTAYVLLSRCNLHPEKHFRLEDFQNLCDFNTPKLVQILGVAVNQASSQVLHQIGMTVLNCGRQKQAAQQYNNSSEAEGEDKPSASCNPKKPTVQEIYNQYKPVIKNFLLSDMAYQNACKNSDRENAELEGEAAVKRAALSISDLRFMKVFYDLSEFHHKILHEVFSETYPMLTGTHEQKQKPAIAETEQKDALEDTPQPVVDEPIPKDNTNPDDITAAEQAQDNTTSDIAEAAPIETSMECDHSEASTKPDAQLPIVALEPETQELPAVDYQVGDTVYLEDTAYQITDIGLFDVQLRDPSLLYPVFRSESKKRFEDMLRRDPRNATKKQEIVLEASEVKELPAAENFVITDDKLGEGGAKAKFQMNMAAITALKQIESENRTATPEEQETLSQYVGWGGLPDAFDESKAGWEKEYQELKTALTPEEYTSARASTLNAHYTSPVIIKAIYAAISNMGFQGGNILEPSCGIGSFFGLLPKNMKNSKLYGVELDSISGRIAKLLYPKAKIDVCGYEKTSYPNNFFNLAVGNVPFGQYKVNDAAYNKLGFSIHNYFLAKALDQVHPGGIVAFVTSRYTMDSKDNDIRKYLAERAGLLGAIRLPNNAFKANAGTEVVSDILFLQKRDSPCIEEPAWVQTAENPDGFAVNSYFMDNPDMVLGNQTSESTAHGMDYTVLPIPDADLAAQLLEAVSQIKGCYHAAAPAEQEESSHTDTLSANPDIKNYSFTIVEGEVYYRENSRMTKQELNQTAKSRVKGMIALRDSVQWLIHLQMDESVTNSAITQKQAELNQLYDIFTHKYGLINDRANRLAFDRDSSYYLLCSLEILDDNGNLLRKADMFTKRTIKQHKTVSSVSTASEALTVSIGEHAKVDLPFMAKLTGKTEDTLIRELHGVIFKDPATGIYQTADEYLSGNVRRKLRLAGKAAEQDSAYQINVEALAAAQPKDLDASEIEVRLGATWIDKSYIQQFMFETLNTPNYLHNIITVNYSDITTEWFINNKSKIPYNDVAAYTTYGTNRANAYKILEDSLNLRDVRIYDTVEDADGKEKRVLNAKETTLASQKQQAIRNAFQDWIFKDARRRQTLVSLYNEKFNSIRPREYNGGHIIFSGINPEIKLQPHQLNAIAHVLYGGNTLLGHEVGAGKTFEMIASAMESKRLGLCTKSIVVVPNHLTEQTSAEWLRLYPAANILVTTKKDFETANRKKFCARIATSDIDAVIIGHSQFERIPISRERQERLIESQIDEITEGIQEAKLSGGERFTIKQLERTRKSLEDRLEKLQANDRKDDVVTFEELGVDMMFVDESDNYKNLFLYTKMRNVAGLSTSDAQKSSDMFAKCQYLDEITGGRGVVFATGTPISNSMTEMYTIQRYLQYNRLQELGMSHFDKWASTFGETTTALELAPEGTGYRARTRFAKFFNLPELMQIFKEVADIKTADQLNLPTPEVEYHNIVSEPTQHQQAMVKELSKRAEKVHNGLDAHIDNMLKITSDGRKLGLDQRIINPLLPDEPGTKVNLCVANVLKHWREGDAEKLTQLIFCDISTPSANISEEETGFTNVYDDIRKKLIAGGMKPEQVIFIHEAKTDLQKKELFAKVRSGQVLVLIGSTQKMGAGTNVQDRLIALHDLDAPWRPRDLIQRKGRIERRGNQNPKVHVYRYATNGTFDAYLWQTLENKQKFISQIMTSKSPVRSCEDVDETALSFAEIKALCAGDPRIKERMDLDLEVSKLRIMKADHNSKQYRLEDDILKNFPSQIKEAQGFIAGLQTDIQTLKQHPHPADGFAGMEIQGMTYTDKASAGTALLDACQEISSTEPANIGSYRGFSLSVKFSGFTHKLNLKGAVAYQVELGADARGNLTRIDNALDKMPESLKNYKTKLTNLLQQQEAAKAESGKPFPQEEELRLKSARLAELDAELNLSSSKPQPNGTTA